MTDIIIPNRKKRLQKYTHHEDSNMQNPLPKEFIADQKRRSERFMKKGGKK
jgi:hypothetical protein